MLGPVIDLPAGRNDRKHTEPPKRNWFSQSRLDECIRFGIVTMRGSCLKRGSGLLRSSCLMRGSGLMRGSLDIKKGRLHGMQSAKAEDTGLEPAAPCGVPQFQ